MHLHVFTHDTSVTEINTKNVRTGIFKYPVVYILLIKHIHAFSYTRVIFLYNFL